MKKKSLSIVLAAQFMCLEVAHAEGMCLPKEEVIFNCEFSQSISSLCVSDDGSVTYRSGSLKKIRLEVSNKKRREELFHLSSRSLVGGGEAHVRFNNNGYAYYMYDKISVTNDGEESIAGVIILKKIPKYSSMPAVMTHRYEKKLTRFSPAKIIEILGNRLRSRRGRRTPSYTPGRLIS